MKTKLIYTIEHEAVVAFEDKEGMRQAVVISVDDLPATISGNVIELKEDVIKAGTPYGITLNELMDVIGTDHLLSKLRELNIWTIQEMKEHPQTVARLVSAHTMKYIRMFTEVTE